MINRHSGCVLCSTNWMYISRARAGCIVPCITAIASFAEVDSEHAAEWQPTVVLVDEANRLREVVDEEVAGPRRRLSAL